jgi:hypothetical protein
MSIRRQVDLAGRPVQSTPHAQTPPLSSPAVCCLLAGCLAATGHVPPTRGRRRPLQLEIDGRWIGHGVSFSPYRDGQEPGGAVPGEAEILADLRLVTPYWSLLRMYDSTIVAERTLALIRRERLPARVLLGAWINPESNRGLHRRQPGRVRPRHPPRQRLPGHRDRRDRRQRDLRGLVGSPLRSRACSSPGSVTSARRCASP